MLPVKIHRGLATRSDLWGGLYSSDIPGRYNSDSGIERSITDTLDGQDTQECDPCVTTGRGPIVTHGSGQ